MHVLAFDTCLGALSVAVGWHRQGEWQTKAAFERRAGGHAERLMPMIAEVLGEAGVGFSAIDRIAVTVGPGSFTGVRVGVAAARGLALASARPLIGATSLAVMAQEAWARLGSAYSDRPLAVAVDARQGLLFLQRFEAGQGAGGPPELVAPAQAGPLLAGRPLLLVGSGAEALCAAVRAAGGEAEAVLCGLEPHARSLALMATALAPAGPVRPLYLRPPDARAQGEKGLARARS
jgi:tRNA threonylcarbamoyl adenosine modification protein YeaZ